MNGSKTRKKKLRINKIRLDGDTQPRDEIDQGVVLEYAEEMESGAVFPPVDVFFDGANYWLVDGFHRRWAAVEANVESLACIVHEGTLDDARWFSYARNTDHGLRRTNADKRKAVLQALKHPKGVDDSDGLIAEHCGVSVKTVSKHRAELTTTMEIPELTTRKGKDGRVRDTTNIGKKKAKAGDRTKTKAERADDRFYEQAVRHVKSGGTASAAALMGLLKIGYKRAEALAKRLRKEGVSKAKSEAVSVTVATTSKPKPESDDWRDNLRRTANDVVDTGGVEPHQVAAELETIAADIRREAA